MADKKRRGPVIIEQTVRLNSEDEKGTVKAERTNIDYIGGVIDKLRDHGGDPIITDGPHHEVVPGDDKTHGLRSYVAIYVNADVEIPS